VYKYLGIIYFYLIRKQVFICKLRTLNHKNFAKYISDSFTAEMENELDEIAEGTRDYTKTLSDFYTPFTAEVAEKDKLAKATNLGDADAHHVCPKCGYVELNADNAKKLI
jgi:rubrerythrin